MKRSFTALQSDFAQRFAADGFGALGRGTAVVVPSLTFPETELRKITGIEHYEERLLCYLLVLRERSTRVVYLTSTEVDPAIVEYYLSFLPHPEEARRRLAMISVGDPSPRPLTEKLLERPDLLEDIRSAAADPDVVFILPFNVTPLEERLAEVLSIPVYGADPCLAGHGSKSGARRLARRAGVPVLEGAEDLRSVSELETAVERLLSRRPDARAVVVKLDNGFSGQGNAVIDVSRLASPIDSSVTVFCAEEESWSSYGPKIAADGAIVEEQLRVAGLVSPSVQLRIAPGGEIEEVSTHDQILGGPDDQVYLGCRFPARREYRDLIRRYGARIARHLAEDGVIGTFGIDFVVIPAATGYEAYLTEINLRVGGTTHPYVMAKDVTGAAYDPQRGELIAGGANVCYVASDNIKSERYAGILPARAIGAVHESGLAYDPSRKSGVTLHLLGALPKYGKCGATCIAPDLDQAAALHDDLSALLDELAEG
jgi:hypothetical protein